MELWNLKPAEGSKKKKIRVGRGESSGCGKTSGRGGKGQTARSGGGVSSYFEGGQMPLYRRIPKIGFRSRRRIRGENQYLIVNLSDLERFDAGSVVDAESLKQAGKVPSPKELAGVKVLGKGELTKKLVLKVNAISESAKNKIESLGGSVEIVKE